MKKISLFLVLMGFCFNLFAQEIACMVSNREGIPLALVEAINIKTNRIFYTDNNGVVKIEGSKTDTIRFSRNGYSQTEFTISNIISSRNRINLFPQMTKELSELIVMPIDMYAIYEKAVSNLKANLIINSNQQYKCVGTEKEVNKGSERGLNCLFTATLKKTNPKKKDLDYSFLLAELNSYSDIDNSEIMQDNKYRIKLFRNYINNSLDKSNANSVYITDSTIIIYSKDTNSIINTFTINRKDTTLIALNYERLNPEKKFTQRRTFKGKNLHASGETIFSKKEGVYYLSSMSLFFDSSFLLGKPQKEERLVCMYKITAINETIRSDLKFTPRNKQLFEMGSYKNQQSIR